MQEVFEKIIVNLETEVLKSRGNMTRTYAFEKAIEIVKQAASEYNDGWIPCSERFPEERQDVLVCFDNIDGCIIAWYDPNGDTWRNSSTDNICKADTIAWMPLPAPHNPHICTNNDCTFNEGKDCPAAEGCAGYDRKQTNADRIRSMSGEELATNMMCPNESGLGEIECDKSDNCNCYECLLKWLQQEVEE